METWADQQNGSGGDRIDSVVRMSGAVVARVPPCHPYAQGNDGRGRDGRRGDGNTRAHVANNDAHKQTRPDTHPHSHRNISANGNANSNPETNIRNEGTDERNPNAGLI